jgi:hypothetical protein
MSKNEIKVSVQVNDNGSLKQVTASADKAASALNQTASGAASADRAIKGASQQSSNSTKNFSKMAQGLSGGVVRAYATLAANLFALGAAFRYLQNAADFNSMLEAQKNYAIGSGVMFNSLTKSLRSASEGVLSLQQAVKMSSLAVAAGLNAKDLEDYAKAANNAGDLLGESFESVTNRLIKTTASGRATLLREIGVTVNATKAQKDYAKSIDKSVDSLTEYEKKRASIEAIKVEMNKNFGDAGAAPNPFEMLLSRIMDVVTAVTQTLLPAFELVAKIMTKNLYAVITVLGLLSVNILKTAINTEFISKKFEEWRDRVGASIKSTTENLKGLRRELVGVKQIQQEVLADASAGLKSGAQAAINEGGTGKILGTLANEGSIRKQDRKILATALDEQERILSLEAGSAERAKAIQSRKYKFTQTLSAETVQILKMHLKDLQVAEELQVTQAEAAKNRLHRAVLRLQAAYQKLKLVTVNTLSATATKASKAAAALGKMLSALGWVGIVLMVVQLFKKLYDNIFGITTTILGLVDKVMPTLQEGFAKIMSTIIKIVLGGGVYIIKLFQTIFITYLSSVTYLLRMIPAIGKILNAQIDKMKASIDSGFQDRMKKVEDIAEATANKMKEPLSLRDAFENSGIGKWAAELKRASSATEAHKEAVEELKSSIKAANKDIADFNLMMSQSVIDPDVATKQAKAYFAAISSGVMSSNLQRAVDLKDYGQIKAARDTIATASQNVPELKPIIALIDAKKYDEALKGLKSLETGAGETNQAILSLNESIKSFESGDMVSKSVDEIAFAFTKLQKEAQETIKILVTLAMFQFKIGNIIQAVRYLQLASELKDSFDEQAGDFAWSVKAESESRRVAVALEDVNKKMEELGTLENEYAKTSRLSLDLQRALLAVSAKTNAIEVLKEKKELDTANIDSIQKQIELEEAALKTLKAKYNVLLNNKGIREEIIRLQENELKLQRNQELLNQINRFTDLRKEYSSLVKEISAVNAELSIMYSNPYSSGELSNRQLLALLEEEQDRLHELDKDGLSLVEKEFQIKMAMIDLEYGLLEVKFDLLATEAKLKGQDFILGYIDAYKDVLSMSKAEAIRVERQKQILSLSQQEAEIIRIQNKIRSDSRDLAIEEAQSRQKALDIEYEIAELTTRINRNRQRLDTPGIRQEPEATSKYRDIYEASKSKSDSINELFALEESKLNTDLKSTLAAINDKKGLSPLQKQEESNEEKLKYRIKLSELEIQKKKDLKTATDELTAAEVAYRDVILSSSNTGDTTSDRILNMSTAMSNLGGFDTLSLGEKFQAMASSISPMFEQLTQLGPEGELVASVVQGAMAIATSWSSAIEVLSSGAEPMAKAAEVAQVIASTIAQVSNMLNASSNARIDAIQREIDMEKKRDGQSAGSLAKIAQLEKKKEAQEKKAFERNKKMQMASVVMSTASAIMACFVPEYGGSPFWGWAMAAIIGAMGAAQLAMLAGASYEGGASSSPSTGAPTSVSLGEKDYSVDLAKSASAAGELAYLRNERGYGTGMSNFRPAFAGIRHRAVGGGTAGYIVGERGPELFIPETPGVIKPSGDDSSNSEMNVKFEIYALDSKSVEDMLTTNQGVIIRNIRRAANQHGEFFLEKVQENSLT